MVKTLQITSHWGCFLALSMPAGSYEDSGDAVFKVPQCRIEYLIESLRFRRNLFCLSRQIPAYVLVCSHLFLLNYSKFQLFGAFY